MRCLSFYLFCEICQDGSYFSDHHNRQQLSINRIVDLIRVMREKYRKIKNSEHMLFPSSFFFSLQKDSWIMLLSLNLSAPKAHCLGVSRYSMQTTCWLCVLIIAIIIKRKLEEICFNHTQFTKTNKKLYGTDETIKI